MTVRNPSTTDKIYWFGEDQAFSSGNTATGDTLYGPNEQGGDYMFGTLNPGQKFSATIVTTDCFLSGQYYTYIFGGSTSSGATLAPQASILIC